MTTTKAERAHIKLCAEAQAMATEQGEQWLKANPEALLVQACWEASKRYGSDDPYLQVWGFLQGFTNARQRREEYLNEQKQNERNPT